MIPVIYYHRVGPFAAGAERKMNVEPGRFRAQMIHLARRYRVVTLDEVLAGATGRVAAITFDDGYRDLMEHAVPVLRELRLPATFFIVAGAIGAKDAWYRSEQEIVTWEDLEKLKFMGFEIGAHSMTHPRLTELDDSKLEWELREPKRLIEERLGVPVRHLAYPQGQHDERVKKAVQAAGYRAAWATKSGEGGEFAMRRFRVAADTGGLAFAWRLMRIRWGWY
jgi:peptidoglycan/xylan/chitin deacetylase (PgdA/CDA1 family)